MIDSNGLRANVGMILWHKNERGIVELFLCKRINKDAWQFPQGGVIENERPIDTMYRELSEELGLSSNDVELTYTSKQSLTYKLPQNLIRFDKQPICYGQKQIWYLLHLKDDSKVNLNFYKAPEFDEFCWTSYWYPMRSVIFFKREVYRKILIEFLPILFPKIQKIYLTDPF